MLRSWIVAGAKDDSQPPPDRCQKSLNPVLLAEEDRDVLVEGPDYRSRSPDSEARPRWTGSGLTRITRAIHRIDRFIILGHRSPYVASDSCRTCLMASEVSCHPFEDLRTMPPDSSACRAVSRRSLRCGVTKSLSVEVVA